MSNHRVEVGPFSFNFSDVLLPMGLKVSRVEVTGTGAAVESKPFALNLVQPGSLVAEVLEQDLTAFLEKQEIAGMHSFSVQAEAGKLHVRAKKTLLVDLKITATASLRIVDERQLWIDVESVDVMGAGAKNLVQSQLDKVNPVLDVADLPVNATLEAVEAEGGKVVLRGTVAPPNFG